MHASERNLFKRLMENDGRRGGEGERGAARERDEFLAQQIEVHENRNSNTRRQPERAPGGGWGCTPLDTSQGRFSKSFTLCPLNRYAVPDKAR